MNDAERPLGEVAPPMITLMTLYHGTIAYDSIISSYQRIGAFQIVDLSDS